MGEKMGVWRWFNTLFSINSDEKKEPTSADEIKFVTDAELEDLKDNIYERLNKTEIKLKKISDFIPDKGKYITNRINSLRDSLMNDNIKAVNVMAEVIEIEKEVEAEYRISEIEKQNKQMKECFLESIENIQSLRDRIESVKSHIEKIQEDVDRERESGTLSFKQEQEKRFQIASLEAEYRLKMLILLRDEVESPWEDLSVEPRENPFEDLPGKKQDIFSGWLLDDVKKIGEDFQNLARSKKIIDKYYIKMNMTRLTELEKRLDKTQKDACSAETFSLKELLDSNSTEINSEIFLREMVMLRYHINQINSKLSEYEKHEEKIKMEKQKKAEKDAAKDEKYRTMSNQEIEAEIQRILNDLGIKGNRFINVLEFQKNIARSRGLLKSEENKNDIKFIPASASDLYSLIKLANDKGITYTVLPGSQEFEDSKGYLFMTNTNNMVEANMLPPFFIEGGPNSGTEVLGEYTIPVLWMIHKKLEERLKAESEEIDSVKSELRRSRQEHDGKYKLTFETAYSIFNEPSKTERKKEFIRDTIFQVYDELRSSEAYANELLEEVSCYLSVPAIRNIIPILEELQNAGIPFYFEPVPQGTRNQRNRDNIHIYFNRKYLSEYKSRVERKVSTPGKPVMINGESINFYADMIEECSWENAGIDTKEVYEE